MESWKLINKEANTLLSIGDWKGKYAEIRTLASVYHAGVLDTESLIAVEAYDFTCQSRAEYYIMCRLFHTLCISHC
jgi:hypothetical protein